MSLESNSHMGREVRITIDDDEVFERMKRRKRGLDLSWEEVLRRGLEHRDEGGEQVRGEPWPDEESGGWDEAGGRGGHGGRHPPLSPFDDDFERRLRERIEGSVRRSMPDFGFGPGFDAPEPPDPPRSRDPLGADIDRLEDAEDAVLSFDFLDDAESAVPLRVNLRTSRSGLDVEVVAVRRGKGARERNRFGEGARKTIAERLVAGDGATLRTEDDDEEYRVFPVLSWTRDGAGHPTVADVEIEEVVFDDE